MAGVENIKRKRRRLVSLWEECCYCDDGIYRTHSLLLCAVAGTEQKNMDGGGRWGLSANRKLRFLIEDIGSSFFFLKSIAVSVFSSVLSSDGFIHVLLCMCVYLIYLHRTHITSISKEEAKNITCWII